MQLDTAEGMDVVAEATDGCEAVDAARRHRPDVLLLDIRMPILDGIGATAQIAVCEDSPTRVVILTTFDLDEYFYGALRAGASGFLLKDVSPEHLVDGIRTMAGGDSLLAPSVTTRLIQTAIESSTPAVVPPELGELTPR